MAGDWIKFRGNLWDDPRVARLCDLTEQIEATVIGGLYWIWATGDQHSEDGTLPGLTLKQIDRKTGIAGLADAMCEIGWLSEEPSGVRIVRFEEHNGSSAKRRATDARRKANVRNSSAPDADISRTECGAREREEKEEERESLSPPSVPLAGDGDGVAKLPRAKPTPGSAGLRFADFWAAWPKNERKQDKGKCLAKWKAKCLDLQADAVLADIAVKRQTQKWRDGFVEAPLVYLNGERWEDGVQPQEAGQEAAAVSHWYETKGGVEAMAKRVGMDPWQPVDERGASVPWGRYVARVKVAVEEAGIEA